MMNFDQTIKFSDIARIRNGYAFKSKDYTKTGVKLLRQSNLTGHSANMTEAKYLPSEFITEYSQFIIKKGDVLIGLSGSIGEPSIYIEDEPALQNQRTGLIQPVDNDPSTMFYVRYLLLFLTNELMSSSKGAGIQNLSAHDIENLTVPFHDNHERPLITKRLDEAFSKIDDGISNLVDVENKLEFYRQSVLKDAFEGKLTADWRAANPDLVEPADKLLARIEAERKAAHQAELDAWENAVNQWEANGKEGKKPTKPKFFQFDEEVIKSSSTMLSMKLGLTISEPKYGTSKKCSYESGQVPVLRIPNLGRGKIDSQDLKYADFSRDELDNYKLESGDLLIIRSNGSVSLVGKTCVISEQEEGFLFAGYLIRIKPIQSIICSEYLRHILGSLALRKQIVEKAKSTSGVNNLNAKEIQNLTINLISLKEQQKLVEMLSENEARYHDQRSILNELKRKADALKQSILKQAFSGHELLEDAS